MVHADIRGRFLLAGASNESGVVDDGNFWRFEWLLLRKLQTLSPAILYGDTLPLVYPLSVCN